MDLKKYLAICLTTTLQKYWRDDSSTCSEGTKTIWFERADIHKSKHVDVNAVA